MVRDERNNVGETLRTDHVRKEAKSNLTDHCAARGSNFDGSRSVLGNGTGRGCALPVHNAEHVHNETDGEDVVGILHKH